MISKQRTHDINIGCCHFHEVPIPQQLGLTTRSRFMPKGLCHIQLIRSENTILELLDLEIASSPTSLSTCCDHLEQQVVAKFGKCVDVHCLQWIVRHHLILGPDLLCLVAENLKRLKIFAGQPLRLVPLTHFSLSKVESIRVRFWPRLQPCQCRLHLEQQQQQ